MRKFILCMEALGREIALQINNNQVIGIGTGSTADCAVQAIGERIKNEKLSVFGITTSKASSFKCAKARITVLDPLSFEGKLDFGFDGADEIDPQGRVLKGRGAAMLMEKIVAKRCRKYFIIADESKIVGTLGEKFPVPIEIIAEAVGVVKDALYDLGAKEITLRDSTHGKYGPVITDAGNIILDVKFNAVRDNLEKEIKSIVGVVESGLFLGYANEILIYKKGEIVRITPKISSYNLPKL